MEDNMETLSEEKKENKVKKLSKAKILELTEKKRDEYFKALTAELKDEEKSIKKALSRKENAEKKRNRAKVNHAKYVICGELLKSDMAERFLTKLAREKTFVPRTALGLNILMKELNFNIVFKVEKKETIKKVEAEKK